MEVLAYDSLVVNAGLTYALNNNIVLFGGIGVEGAYVETENKDDLYRNNTFNANGGVMIYLLETKLGLTIEYNSAPKLITVGVVHRW